MSNNNWIVVQGPSNHPFTLKVIDFYSRFPNVVWSTWSDTPENIIDKLRTSGMDYLINPYPEKTGFAHLNYQCQSTLAGVSFAEARGAQSVFKTRTDILFPKIHEIAELISRKMGERKLAVLEYDDHSKGITDFCVYGDIKYHKLFWSVSQIDRPVESILMEEYFTKIGRPIPSNRSEAMRDIYFFLDDLMDQCILVDWLKRPDHSPLNHKVRLTRGRI